PGLIMELILQEPEIMTPIGLTIDEKDHLYVLESHTHTPMQDYQGPAFDRIKKGLDTDGDYEIDQWIIFADSIEDGMNLNYHQNYGVFLATKNQVLQFKDTDHDGVADQRTEILKMYPPENVYDHAGILGVVAGNDGWIYVSRGNCGSSFWQIKSMTGEMIEGYGDGGNVFRCKVDGTGLEEVATGFWNPFGLAFSAEGRLLLTDNDPDSRGPNRLIEVVPGGNYGYQSLYGGSGIHPYLAWNGELPGTLPYAAPLGEAPCGLIDASFTNLGKSFQNHILASVWEENNIVMIPLEKRGSYIYGEPKVLIQGGKDFHPVAYAANSRGDVYFTDWVIRQYPNHGHGKIWKLSSRKSKPLIAQNQTEKRAIDRFAAINLSDEEITQKLENGDPFERTIIRNHLIKSSNEELARSFLQSKNPKLRLEGILVMMGLKSQLGQPVLQTLLKDEGEEIRRITLIYIGKRSRDDMRASLEEALKTGYISP
ncbi:MAG: dehydrogenase, partial [Bacteroidetes bacterium]|nr:dehydrogenase [Bacteroidota bacterium]